MHCEAGQVTTLYLPMARFGALLPLCSVMLTIAGWLESRDSSRWLAGAQVDVYSFGVVLWELWSGREPYEGLNYHALLHQITLTGGGLRPTLPNSPKWEYEPVPEPAPGWCSLMERCWQEVPEKRPSFAEVPISPSMPHVHARIIRS